jgi:hypothetical protein
MAPVEGAVTSRSREDKDQSDACGSVATILSIHITAGRRSSGTSCDAATLRRREDDGLSLREGLGHFRGA